MSRVPIPDIGRKRGPCLIHTRRLCNDVYRVLQARRIRNAGFSHRIMVSAFNKLAIFLARYREGEPTDSRRAPRASGSSARTRRKALLMRSLIRQIDECFARSDVYPSRSTTTRCVDRPPFTHDKKRLNFVSVPFSLTRLI